MNNDKEIGALMKRTTSLIALFLSCISLRADDLRVSTMEPLVAVTTNKWQSAPDRQPGGAFPFETYRIVPPGSRNAACLVSILDKNRKEFGNPDVLKKILRGDCLPYVNSPDELSKIDLKEMKINGGLGFIVNFVDPDLVGKPVIKGSYKTGTPVIFSLGSNYLFKVTILCDEIDGADYRDAIAIVQSIKVKKE